MLLSKYNDEQKMFFIYKAMFTGHSLTLLHSFQLFKACSIVYCTVLFFCQISIYCMFVKTNICILIS